MHTWTDDTQTDSSRTAGPRTTERRRGPGKGMFVLGGLLLARAAARRRLTHHGDSDTAGGHHRPPWAARMDASAAEHGPRVGRRSRRCHGSERSTSHDTDRDAFPSDDVTVEDGADDVVTA